MRKRTLLSVLMLGLFLACLATLQIGKQSALASGSSLDSEKLTAVPTRVNRISASGIRFGVYQIVRLDAYQDHFPENDTFLVITGALESAETRCVIASDFKIMLGETEYLPVVSLMESLQPVMRERAYPATSRSPQCIQRDIEAPTYLIYDLPLSADPVILRFFERDGFIGDLSGLQVISDTDASILRFVLGEPHRLRRNSNVRACAGTTCDILHIFLKDQTVIKIGETFGMEVRGSQIWNEVLLEDDTTGYIHGSLMRRITP